MQEKELIALAQLLGEKFPRAKVNYNVPDQKIRIVNDTEGIDALDIADSLRTIGIETATTALPRTGRDENLPSKSWVADNFSVEYNARSFEGKTDELKKLQVQNSRWRISNPNSFSDVKGRSL